ncbi:MAG: putative DNA-binding domain-containing protein [Nitrosomonas sp.]|nr:putative DNA-binding domain-containing protein [Nitrosomonas sp.]
MVTYNTPDRPGFVRQQYEFAAHIRNPEKNPHPSTIEKRRMNIYCELFYNNVEDLIANTFPVLRKIMPDSHWHALIRDYFADHLSHTPLFPEIPREFLRYIESERKSCAYDPPFLFELAHYEWVELALSIFDESQTEMAVDTEGDLFDGIPAISPLAWLLSYSFPVHKISESFQPEVPGGLETNLIVYRDKHFNVQFIEVNKITARLVHLVGENSLKSGFALLRQIAAEMGHPQPDAVMHGGVQILNDLRKRGVVYRLS